MDICFLVDNQLFSLAHGSGLGSSRTRRHRKVSLIPKKKYMDESFIKILKDLKGRIFILLHLTPYIEGSNNWKGVEAIAKIEF